MDSFSEKVESVEPSATLRIGELASDLEEKGKDVIDLSVGEPDYNTPAHIREEAKNALDRGKTGYTAGTGIPGLREAISHKFREENGLDVERDEVIVTPGAKMALFETIFALLQDGEKATLLDPSWVSYQAMIKFAGGEVDRVELDPSTGFTPGDVDLAEKIDPDTKFVIVNTPCNPTGAVFDEKELAEIRDLSIDHDFWVISDEIYEKIIYDDAVHHSIGAMEGMGNRTVTINGFSKAYAMTGWRLGYLTAPNHLLNEISKIQSHSVSCATNFSQWGGVAAIDGPQEPTVEMVDTFEDRRDVLVEELGKHGVEIPPPKGAFYAYVPVRSEDDADLCEDIIQNEHVAVTPGSAFGVPGYVRISYAKPAEKIRQGVDRLSDYLGRKN
ncbi:MAG: pyridoxal phosphate-dependent aminotransferase [Halobacteria archaeon]